MVEVFKYTERVVNMARPRKLLMMAIGEFGLACWIVELTMIRRCRTSSQDESAAFKTFQIGTGSC
jgi:5'-3' exonuclease